MLLIFPKKMSILHLSSFHKKEPNIKERDKK